MFFLSKDIIKEWGLSLLSERHQEEAIQKIGKMIYQAVLVRSLDILSAEEEEELELLLNQDKTTPKEVLLFLKSKIPTFEELVREEKHRLKEEILFVGK